MRADSRRRLAAMGVDTWVRRGAGAGTAETAPPIGERSTESGREAGTPDRDGGPRVRLAPGDGRWLLVVDGAEADRHAALVDDVRGVLGTSQCRFARWADSDRSGVGLAELAGHGIQRVVSFTSDAVPAEVISAGPLSELARSPAARRELWSALRAHLEG
ncbi:MAG: hypothetical protein R3323_03365 [Wenzhouxiangellaceae bacterium]|nr:hypothetical protein [Wenzhouxiangellaceae bacterium]